MNRSNKRKLLFFLLVCLFTFGAQGQSYSHYINHTSEWSFYGEGSNLGATTHSHYRYFINGDTAIGQFTYFKLRRQGVDTVIYSNGNPTQVQTYNEYSGALREDAIGSFYFIYNGQATEELLYDFRFGSFFSMPTTRLNQGCNVPPIALQSWERVYFGTTPLMRFHLNAFGNPVIIEGVGSDREFIQQNNLCGIGIEYNTYLVCYKRDNNLLVVNNSKPCGLTLNPGGPDCQAKFCYSLKDTLGGLPIVTLVSTSTSNDSIVSYTWNLAFLGGLSGQNITVHLPNPGTYTATLIIQTASGCMSTIIDTLKNGNTCSNVVTDIDQSPGLQNENIVVAPTILQSYVSIYSKSFKGKTSFIVYDMTGREVKEIELQFPTTILYREGLTSGIYIFRVVNRNKILQTGKIIVQ